MAFEGESWVDGDILCLFHTSELVNKQIWALLFAEDEKGLICASMVISRDVLFEESHLRFEGKLAYSIYYCFDFDIIKIFGLRDMNLCYSNCTLLMVMRPLLA